MARPRSNSPRQRRILWIAFDRLRLAQVAPLRRRVTQLFLAQGQAAERALRAGAGAGGVATVITGFERLWQQHLTAWYRDTMRTLADAQARLLGGRVRAGAGKSAGRPPSKAAEQPMEVEVSIGGFPDPGGGAWEFDPWNEEVAKNVDAFVAKKITGINSVTADKVAKLIGPMLEEGRPIDEIAAALQSKFAEFGNRRAWMIARTESGFAMGMAQEEAAKASGVVNSKTWSNSGDERVRDLHENAPQGVGGETVAMTAKFSNGLRFPCDPEGPPEQVINCRCVCLYGVDDAALTEDPAEEVAEPGQAEGTPAGATPEAQAAAPPPTPEEVFQQDLAALVTAGLQDEKKVIEAGRKVGGEVERRLKQAGVTPPLTADFKAIRRQAGI